MSTPFPLAVGSQKSRLAAAIAAAPLVAAKVLLFTNDYTPNINTLLADLTEATFGGYTAGGNAVAWGVVGLDVNGVPVAPSNQNFTADGTGPTEEVFGAYLLDSTGALVGAGRFDQSRVMAANGDQISMSLLFGLTLATLNLAVGP